MHRSFGMETRPDSLLWPDLMKGPPLGAVRAHLRKLADYRQLMLETGETSHPRLE